MAKKPYSGNADNWKFNPHVFDPHPWHKRKPVNWTGVVVHCAATKASMNVGVDQIDYWHRQRGFEGVGYNYVIRRDGTVEKGRPDTVPGAHAVGYNLTHLGVCLVGGLDEKGNPEDNFTSAQYESLYKVLFNLVGMHHLKTINGHNELPDVHKACPCFSVADWLEGYPALQELLRRNNSK